MLHLYGNWIDSWDRRLAAQDTARLELPFEWGLEWLDPNEAANTDPGQALSEFAQRATADSTSFFDYERPADFRERDGRLTFTSPLESPYPENNKVHATYFPVESKRAVVVLPQWNADPQGHMGLCRLMNRFGLSALRMSKAYHDQRRPAGHARAEFHVSGNLGRTIQATRQSIVDARCCVDWLAGQGYSRIGIVGTSLGSCVAFITAAHESRLNAGVFNHVSANFGDVVWTGTATEHVRKSLERRVSQEDLRDYWAVISPVTFARRLQLREFRSLVIWARRDTVFRPEFTREFIRQFQATKVLSLPCGHYTIGEFPFKWIDGLAICRFLANQL
jgi:alpha/beta hydrolase family protein